VTPAARVRIEQAPAARIFALEAFERPVQVKVRTGFEYVRCTGH